MALELVSGAGGPGNGPVSENSAGYIQKQPGRPILAPIRGSIVILGSRPKECKAIKRISLHWVP